MSMQVVSAETGVFERLHVADCYQCGKCSAGCPVAEQMDLLPNQLVRLVQMGRLDRALKCEAIWKCVSCMTCSTRCPKSVDCAGVMDALRQLAVERGKASKERLRTVLFQQAFLDNIRRNGRLCEVELIGAFKTKAFFRDGSVSLLLKDAMLAPQLLKREKFHLLGERVKDRGVVAADFREMQPTAKSIARFLWRDGRDRSTTCEEATNSGFRLLSRMCLARIVERLRPIGPRLSGGVGRWAARAGRLDLLRRDGRPFVEPHAGRGPAGAKSGHRRARRTAEPPGALSHVLDGVAEGPERAGRLGRRPPANVGHRRVADSRRHPACSI